MEIYQNRGQTTVLADASGPAIAAGRHAPLEHLCDFALETSITQGVVPIDRIAETGAEGLNFNPSVPFCVRRH